MVHKVKRQEEKNIIQQGIEGWGMLFKTVKSLKPKKKEENVGGETQNGEQTQSTQTT
jgi:hypothetical protein